MAQQHSDVLVVLPTLGKRLESLERALDSVNAQEHRESIRLVAVIPQEAREARALAAGAGAEIVDDPGEGMSAAINAGIDAARGESFYIWLGDDDRFRPSGIARLRALLDENPRAVVAYGACDYVDEDDRVLWTSKAGALAYRLIGYGPNLVPHPAALIRLDSLKAVGGYDESLSLTMDLDLFLKLKKRGPFIHTRDVVSAFGWQPTSLTVQDRRASSAEARSVKRKHLAPALRVVEPLWEYPVQWASQIAARRLNGQPRPQSTK